MARYILFRLLGVIALILVASVLVFLIIHMIPGDPVVMMLGSNAASKSAIIHLRDALGLNLPLYTQFFRWATNILFAGNFGVSMVNHIPVATLLQENYPSTLQLTVGALIVAIVFGVSLGVIAAVNHNKFLDSATMVIALIGLAMPSFWLGLLLISLFGVALHILPVFGGTGIRAVILPAIALGIGGGGVVARYVRSNLLETIHKQHVTTARSKGLSASTVLLKHVLRNSMLPVVTVLGLQFGALLSGVVVVEEVFSRPGVGSLLVTSILDKDYPTVQAVILVLTISYALTNLIVDLLYPVLDPRIVYS